MPPSLSMDQERIRFGHLNDANRALLSGNLPPKWQFALLLFFSFHSHQRKLSKKKKREIVLLNGSDGWLITHHKSSDHLFLPWLFTSILFEKQILLLKSPVFITDGAGSPIQSCAKFFLFSLPLTNAPRFSHAFQHFSCAIVDGSMTFFFLIFDEDKKDIYLLLLYFDNFTTRLDFLTVDAFLYFSSFVSSFLKISSHCIYCHLTNRLALWVDPIDLTIKRDDIIVPYYYFWKKKKKQKKTKQNKKSIIQFSHLQRRMAFSMTGLALPSLSQARLGYFCFHFWNSRWSETRITLLFGHGNSTERLFDVWAWRSDD